MATPFQRIIRATRGRIARAVGKWTAPFDQPRDDYDPSRYVHISLAQSTDLSSNRKGPPEGEYGDIPVSIWAEWTVRSIRSAVTQHALGTFGQSGLLVEGMMADDRVQSATNGRIKGVTKCDVMLKPAKVPEGVVVAQEIADLWVDMFPEETIEQLLQWATFEGFALAEIIWEHRRKNDTWFPRLKVWHPLTIYYDIQRRQYVAITMEGPIYVSEDDPKWFLFTPYGSYRGWLRGGVRSCSIPWVVRQFALRDMARFSEKHGMPMLVAKVPAQAPAEDKARFFSSIRNLGAETGIQLPVQGGTDAASWDIQLLEAKDRSWEAFGGLRDMCDQAITLAIRGTNLTTQVDGGSYAAAESHRDEDSDFAVADRKKLAGAIKRQLLDLYCFYNYGSQDSAPTMRFQAPRLEEADKPADEAKTLLDVATAVGALEDKGWPVDRLALAQRFSIPLMEETKEEQEATEQAVLNGAQITALIDTVARVASGELPRSSGVEVLITALQVPRDVAERIVGAAGAGPASGEKVEASEPSEALLKIAAQVTSGEIPAESAATVLKEAGYDDAVIRDLLMPAALQAPGPELPEEPPTEEAPEEIPEAAE